MTEKVSVNDLVVGPYRATFITDPEGLSDPSRRTTLELVGGDFHDDEKQPPIIGTADPAQPFEPPIITDPDLNAPDPYLIVGFDTEYKTPPAVTYKELREGGVKYKVLSYQFRAATSTGLEWEGICLPDGDQRLTVGEFLLFVVASGCRRLGIRNMPKRIYLVGHFMRADLPAFGDFKLFAKKLDAIRGTFATGSRPIKINLGADDVVVADLSVYLCDTMLLTPGSSKSLRELGDLVGVPKVVLHADKVEAKRMISNMDEVRTRDWELFRRYAMTDAVICVKYLQQILRIYFNATGKFKVPLTLSSIGVDLLLGHWDKEGYKYLDVVGKEKFLASVFNKQTQKSKKVPKTASVKRLHRHESLIIECYHGGRNEQFWFGPAFEDDWSDFDLSGAYPTSMALIGEPDWNAIYTTNNVNEFKPWTLGYAEVDFEFPKEIRYPTLPVRWEGSLMFPRTGTSTCSAPEIYLAVRLGAKIKINDGVIVPQDTDQLVFRDFISDCVQKRYAAGKSTLTGLFWKEISNSTYGKLAQGLRKRRIYDIGDGEMRDLPPSKITNSVFAAYITSFTRAVLGEVMNAIPKDRMVFSCTTDGFITNATSSEIQECTKGRLSKIFGVSREGLTDKFEILETKHVIRNPLGWRTRGQATLVPGQSKDVKTTVLAKAGLHTPPELDTIETQNEEIVDQFFRRDADSYITLQSIAGLRDMLEFDDDLVPTSMDRRVNMEFDWKRRPSGITTSTKYNHIAFSTVPWESPEQYVTVRATWKDYNKADLMCLKTAADFDDWVGFLYITTIIDGTDVGKYLDSKRNGLRRVRQMLCAAFKKGKAGFKSNSKVKDQEFADILEEMGIPCTVKNVGSGKTKDFIPNHCVPTKPVVVALFKLKKVFPRLDIDRLIYKGDDNDMVIDLNDLPSNQFLDKVT
jgi:hypothetical protein